MTRYQKIHSTGPLAAQQTDDSMEAERDNKDEDDSSHEAGEQIVEAAGEDDEADIAPLLHNEQGPLAEESTQSTGIYEHLESSPVRSLSSDRLNFSSLRSFGSPVGRRPGLWRTVPRRDSLDVEAMEVTGADPHNAKNHSFATTLGLAFQTIGIVYGDMGTSPLYVFSSAFNELEIGGHKDILGALSIIIYTITLIPLIKYVFIVLYANNNGEGGTLSLYALICRYAKVNLLPNRQPADERLSDFRIQVPTRRLERALKIKYGLEKKFALKNVLLVLILLGTSLVMGDGILTPCISVLSAVSGLSVAMPNLSQDIIVVVAIAIILVLYSLQRFGTGKVGFLFAPILSIWFAAIGSLGVYNILTYDQRVFQAFNPAYIIIFFRRNGLRAWYALGGLVLCITGGEAMFADLGHFSVRSIQIAFSFVVYPCLLLAYMGQAAYLISFPSAVNNAFYKSIPGSLFWPMLVISTLAATIASQAMISATFSVVKMALAIDAFPRVKVIHTSKRFMGQIYVPVVNWFLMVMCIILTATFRSTAQLGNAYGVAVVGDMLVTTSLVTLIMFMIWQTPAFLALTFLIIMGTVELIYLSAVLLKIAEGAWVPLVLAFCVLTVMYTWHYGNRMQYQSQVEQRISTNFMLELGPDLGTIRVKGVGLLYNELVSGVPAIFGHFLKSLPAIHSTVIFVCIKYVPVPKVSQSERFLFRRVCPRNYHMFRCVARYGYKDVRKEDHYIFEQLLLQKLELFLIQEAQEYALEADDRRSSPKSESSENSPFSSMRAPIDSLHEPLLHPDSEGEDTAHTEGKDATLTLLSSNQEQNAFKVDPMTAMEISQLQEASEDGVVYLLGHADVRAKKESWFLKKLVINYAYAFMARNCRASAETLSVPHTNLLEVGMTYMV